MRIVILAVLSALMTGCVSAPILLNCHETCAFDNMKCVSATVSNVPYQANLNVPMQERILPKQFQCVVDDTKLKDYEKYRQQVIEREDQRLKPFRTSTNSSGSSKAKPAFGGF